MIDYEVEAVLKIRDKASPVLLRTLALTRDLEKSIDRLGAIRLGVGGGTEKFVALEKSLKEISPALAKTLKHLKAMPVAVDRAFGTFASKADTTALAIDRLNASLGRTQALSGGIGRIAGGINILSAGAARGSRGGRRGGAHIRAFARGGRAPGLGLSSFGVTPGMGLAFGLGYGIYQEANLEDTISRILFTANSPARGKARDAQRARIRNIIKGAASETGMPLGQLDKAAMTVTRMMAGFPLKSRMDVMKTALEFGAQEVRLDKASSVNEGAGALIGLLHQLGKYDPKSINKFANKIAYLSTVTPVSLRQFATATSYSLPLIQSGVKINPDELLLTQAAMQRSGIMNTKSGTWVRQAIIKLLLGTATMSKTSAKAQATGLRALGLVDAHGKSTVYDAQGNLRLANIAVQINKARQHMTTPQLLLAEKQAFGTQGMAGISQIVSPALQSQMPMLKQAMAKMPNAPQFFKDMFQDSPAQKARKTLADLSNVLVDLAKVAIPTLSKAVVALDHEFIAFENWLGMDTGQVAVMTPHGVKMVEKSKAPAGNGKLSAWDGIYNALFPTSRKQWNKNMQMVGLGGGWHGEQAAAATGAATGAANAAAAATGTGSPYIAPSATGAATIKGDVYINKDKIGEIIGQAIADSASGPQSGLSGFDPSLTLMSSGIGNL